MRDRFLRGANAMLDGAVFVCGVVAMAVMIGALALVIMVVGVAIETTVWKLMGWR